MKKLWNWFRNLSAGGLFLLFVGISIIERVIIPDKQTHLWVNVVIGVAIMLMGINMMMRGRKK